MIQMDLQKAYATVEWDAFKGKGTEKGFLGLFVDWAMTTVLSVSYRYSVNYKPTCILNAKRGVRQGDPFSPFLFVIVIEYLQRCIDKHKYQQDFNYYPRCEKLTITNLCFAADLLVF